MRWQSYPKKSQCIFLTHCFVFGSNETKQNFQKRYLPYEIKRAIQKDQTCHMRSGGGTAV